MHPDIRPACDPVWQCYTDTWVQLVTTKCPIQTLKGLHDIFSTHYSATSLVLSSAQHMTVLQGTSRAGCEWSMKCLEEGLSGITNLLEPTVHTTGFQVRVLALALLCWGSTVQMRSHWFFQVCARDIERLVGEVLSSITTRQTPAESSSPYISHNDLRSSLSGAVHDDHDDAVEHAVALVALALFGWNDACLLKMTVNRTADTLSLLAALGSSLQATCELESSPLNSTSTMRGGVDFCPSDSTADCTHSGAALVRRVPQTSVSTSTPPTLPTRRPYASEKKRTRRGRQMSLSRSAAPTYTTSYSTTATLCTISAAPSRPPPLWRARTLGTSSPLRKSAIQAEDAVTPLPLEQPVKQTHMVPNVTVESLQGTLCRMATPVTAEPTSGTGQSDTTASTASPNATNRRHSTSAQSSSTKSSKSKPRSSQGFPQRCSAF